MKHVIRKKPWLIPLFIILGAAAFIFFGWVVMALWNAALVPATGAGIITFWQGIGLLILSRILVGGFGGGKRNSHQHPMKEKWASMNPDEREQFKQQCRNWWAQKQEGSANSSPTQGND
ncbi:MAG: hypothetical protein IPH18_11360 [Chitinophagaceae bacterium]|nr:hypothetical protein [Chitinophagaceae bacterium]